VREANALRITLVISTLANGGAERVMTVMANYWAERDQEVTLITFASAKEDFYSLHPGIHRVGLNLMGASSHVAVAMKHNFQRLKRLRQEIKASRPDFVLSFIDKTNVLTLVASVGLGIPVIVSERNDPRQHSIGSAWSGLRFLLYRYADAVVVQSHAVHDWARRVVEGKSIYIIPNPVKPEFNGSPQVSSRKGVGHIVIAMGRLARQKGFDLLLRAFARCARKHLDWSLMILGEGEERGRLEALAVKLGIKDRVGMPGRTRDPFRILCGADLFVLPSRYEGFPNALVEAMACKLAVIGADCPSGPRDIIRDGVDGVLVPPNDVDALAAAMDRLMANPAERQRLSARAVEVVERFNIEKIMNMWDEVFTDVCRMAPRDIPPDNQAKNLQSQTQP